MSQPQLCRDWSYGSPGVSAVAMECTAQVLRRLGRALSHSRVGAHLWISPCQVINRSTTELPLTVSYDKISLGRLRFWIHMQDAVYSLQQFGGCLWSWAALGRAGVLDGGGPALASASEEESWASSSHPSAAPPHPSWCGSLRPCHQSLQHLPSMLKVTWGYPGRGALSAVF